VHEEAGLYLGFGVMSPIFYRADEGAEFWLLASGRTPLSRPNGSSPMWRIRRLFKSARLPAFPFMPFGLVAATASATERMKVCPANWISVGRVSHDSRLVRQNHSQLQPHILAGLNRRIPFMARVEGIDPKQTSLLMQQVFKKVRKMLGRDLTPQKIAARVPAGVLNQCARRMAVGTEGGGSQRQRMLLTLRTAVRVGCPF
jgi:hypothetical protein